MHFLTQLIKDDMKPALGVTEPGAIAYATATARTYAGGRAKKVRLRLNSGMFKNAFTCGIPGSSQVGNYHAAALGAVAADPAKGLECLDKISPKAAEEARQMVEDGKITVEMSGISSQIFIEACVETDQGQAVVTIRDAHTNIVMVSVNGKTVFEKDKNVAAETCAGAETAGKENRNSSCHDIHRYTLRDLVEYVRTVPVEEIQFIGDAFRMNMALFEEGLKSPKTSYAAYLLEQNGKTVISRDEQKTASLLCNAAIEARVLGLNKPAMSITGSGAHGIIATMPLYAAYKVSGYSFENLLRATALSYLVCMYIKEYSGKLSAFCGCAIAAGTGMASSITGMICDGGNQGCTMKGVVAVDAAYASVNMAMKGVYIENVHGINGNTPEQTMYHMGRIASPGMEETERVIVEILEEK